MVNRKFLNNDFYDEDIDTDNIIDDEEEVFDDG